MRFGKALYGLLQKEILNWVADWLMSKVKLRNHVITSDDQACPCCIPFRMNLQTECQRWSSRLSESYQSQCLLPARTQKRFNDDSCSVSAAQGIVHCAQALCVLGTRCKLQAP